MWSLCWWDAHDQTKADGSMGGSKRKEGKMVLGWYRMALGWVIWDTSMKETPLMTYIVGILYIPGTAGNISIH